jgi:hypothetical protein
MLAGEQLLEVVARQGVTSVISRELNENMARW